MTASELCADAIYITPLGRRCRFVQSAAGRHERKHHFLFRYLEQDRAGFDGFSLTPENVRILRRESLS